MLPKYRRPNPPGEILLEEFLKPLGMTQRELAEKMDVSVQQVSLLINERRSVTPETALLLAKVLKTTPNFWLNLQNNVDLWDALQHRKAFGRG